MQKPEPSGRRSLNTILQALKLKRFAIMRLRKACFLRARQKLTGSRQSKSRYSTNFQACFARTGKSLAKKLQDKKDRSFDLLSFEGKRNDFGANKPKLRQFEIRAFFNEMRPFSTISVSTFLKIHPDTYMYICIYMHTPTRFYGYTGGVDY